MTKCQTKAMVRALTKVRTYFRTSLPTRSLCTSPSSDTAALKNVTRQNFEPALAELRRVVKEADFVSIDLEMTGLTSAPWRECFEFDRPDIQYLKVKDSAEKFAVVQFGVCPFRWDGQSNTFVAYPHNFYIFPRDEIPGYGLSSEFLCQTSSLEFLAKYQFDFNTCIHEGISYLSRSQEEEALRRLDSVYTSDCELSDSISNMKEVADTESARIADILFSERMKNRISEWRTGLLQGGAGGTDIQESPDGMNQNFQTTFFQMRPALVLNGLTSRQLRLIKMVAEKHFKDLTYVHGTGKSSGLQPLLVYTDSAADHDMLMREVNVYRMQEAKMKIKAAVGFRHILDLLSSERKLIVGHNCFLDLAHVYSKFFGPLPSNAEDFVSAVEQYLPYIIDTKVLLNSNDILFRMMKGGSTSLSKAFRLLCSPVAAALTTSSLAKAPSVKVEVQVDDQRFSNWNSGAKHEAGYDAFMTGSVFAQVCCHLGIDFNSQASTVDLQYHEKLQKYVNHLYLSWVNGDIIASGKGKDAADSFSSTNPKHHNPKVLFSNMLLLWGLSPQLKIRDFRNCMLKVFGTGSVTSIYHLDDTAAFIQFNKAELVAKFLELKDELESENDPISVLHPLSKLLEAGCVCAASYEVYKEICSSPISEVLFTDQTEAMGIKWKTKLVKSAVQVEKLGEYQINCSSDCREENDTNSKSSAAESLSLCYVPDNRDVDYLYPIEAQLSK